MSGDRAHVNVDNPAFAYAGLDEDGDNEGFFEETKVGFPSLLLLPNSLQLSKYNHSDS